MRKLLCLAGFCLCLLWFAFGTQIAPAQAQSSPPQPTLRLYFQQDILRSGEKLPVVLQVTNDSAQALSDITLTINSPSFLAWSDGGCDKQVLAQPDLLLGGLPANGVLHRSLCVQLSDASQTGNFNIQFALEYAWQETGAVRHSLITTEKTLKLELSGAAAIPSVPVKVYFQQDIIRSGDKLPVILQVTNDSAQPLRDIQLNLNSPVFLTWYDGRCDQVEQTQKNQPLPAFPHPLLLSGVLAANDVLNRPLCVQLGDTSQVGDFNIQFAVQYTWQEAGSAHHSLASADKTLKVDLLGVDSILGVPLAFAVFILPGAAFLVLFIPVTKFLKTPLSLSDKTENRLILSVVISALFIWAIRLISNNSPIVEVFDQTSGLSVQKLVLMAVVGGSAGAVAGCGYWGLCFARRKIYQWTHRYYKPLDIEDSNWLLLRKILCINPAVPEHPLRVSVTANNTQHVYSGAHSAVLDGQFFLAGSFRLVTPKIDNSLPELVALKKLGDAHGNLPQTQPVLVKALELLNQAAAKMALKEQKGKKEIEDQILVWRDKVKRDPEDANTDEGLFKSWPVGSVEIQESDETKNVLLEMQI